MAGRTEADTYGMFPLGFKAVAMIKSDDAVNLSNWNFRFLGYVPQLCLRKIMKMILDFIKNRCKISVYFRKFL